MRRAILLIAALALAACGPEAPCQSPGTYCDANTLCADGQPIECSVATGGTCEYHPQWVSDTAVEVVAQCLPPRPPPPGVIP